MRYCTGICVGLGLLALSLMLVGCAPVAGVNDNYPGIYTYSTQPTYIMNPGGFSSTSYTVGRYPNNYVGYRNDNYYRYNEPVRYYSNF